MVSHSDIDKTYERTYSHNRCIRKHYSRHSSREIADNLCRSDPWHYLDGK
jgi:hypothetical protein